MTRVYALALLLLLAFSPIADAPVLEWRLIPVEWKEVSMCREPCIYKVRFVTKYEWISQ